MHRWIRTVSALALAAAGSWATAANEAAPLQAWADAWGPAMAVARECKADAPQALVLLARSDLRAVLRAVLPEAPAGAHAALTAVWVERMQARADAVAEEMKSRPPDCVRELDNLRAFAADTARGLRGGLAEPN